ncbi:MAG TPA: leucyl/phenylalanyl-tRNA--protein transferase [Methylomirabilota bacterium]|nr:leucyl/phenylalanyl-tRNA--protein transferase [Methylomirabilota bacterium]
MVAPSPQMLLKAYALGVFPMAEGRDDPEIYWIDPEVRGVLPLEDFHLPRRLRRTLRHSPFAVRCDTDFDGVISACAAPAPGRADTWINNQIFQLNRQLFRMGFAHTVECWHGDRLVGGLYGIAIGAAFFGESMFSVERDASKVALAHLVMRLKLGGYLLLDTQFVTPHLQRFGAIEISRADYRQRLARAIAAPASFQGEVAPEAAAAFLQSTTQTS